MNLFEKDLATEYVSVTGQTFKIRYQKDEKAILERYVPRMLEEAWGRWCSATASPQDAGADRALRRSRAVQHPHERAPNIGIQGVCFGQTLAAMSPAAGAFNWGNVIWHELGHVFAIQMSKNHVPRWFTEGLSEYETIIRRPEWKREEDPALFAGLKGGRIPAVDSFNKAFTRRRRGGRDHGLLRGEPDPGLHRPGVRLPKVVSMLPRWANGERTPGW